MHFFWSPDSLLWLLNYFGSNFTDKTYVSQSNNTPRFLTADFTWTDKGRRGNLMFGCSLSELMIRVSVLSDFNLINPYISVIISGRQFIRLVEKSLVNLTGR